MNLRNYTSGVPVDRSISAIETLLVQAGAGHISKFYEDQKCAGFMFQITIDHNPINFKLPSDPLAVRRIMEAEVKKAHKGTMQRVAEQAERTAWAILRDWVHIQVTMIQMQQAEALQIFLPYACVGGSDVTLFDKLKGSGFKQLTEGSERNS
jgi:hypothetical protein